MTKFQNLGNHITKNLDLGVISASTDFFDHVKKTDRTGSQVLLPTIQFEHFYNPDSDKMIIYCRTPFSLPTNEVSGEIDFNIKPAPRQKSDNTTTYTMPDAYLMANLTEFLKDQPERVNFDERITPRYVKIPGEIRGSHKAYFLTVFDIKNPERLLDNDGTERLSIPVELELQRIGNFYQRYIAVGDLLLHDTDPAAKTEGNKTWRSTLDSLKPTIIETLTKEGVSQHTWIDTPNLAAEDTQPGHGNWTTSVSGSKKPAERQ